ARSAEAQKLSQAINRARKQLRQAGIEARKQERLRKKSVAQLTELGLPIPLELEDQITDPEAESESQYESARYQVPNHSSIALQRVGPGDAYDGGTRLAVNDEWNGNHGLAAHNTVRLLQATELSHLITSRKF
ncbi:hypothetical protein V491_08733, partial [Pseudogymnoascus sp. VKM F-3775]